MKIIKFCFNFFILLILANIETNLFANIENKIVVRVENQIVSSYELKNKIKTLLLLTNQEINQKNINFTKERALSQLINYKLKKNEVIKADIEVKNNDQIDNYLRKISSRLQTDVSGMKKIFENNDVNFDLYYDEILTEFNWQKLIFEIFGNKINLDENEVSNELNLYLKTQSNIKEYKLAEIEIVLKNNSEDKNTFLEINNQINTEGFEKAAQKYSISTTALDGGNIGWISSKSLSDKILLILNKMKVGDISSPIIQTNNATILKLIDVKNTNINNADLDKLRQQIINSKKNELLNLYSNSHLSKVKNSAFVELNEK